MLNYVGIKKNAEFIFYVNLRDQAAATISFKVSPTIAAGDFQVSTDGGAFGNLATIPVVTPAGGRSVKITLSAAEMNGTNIMVQCVDAAGAEWCDEAINIQTTPVDASLTQIDGTVLASATLNLKKINVVNNSGDAIVAASTGSNGSGLNLSGNGSGHGLIGTGGVTGHGLYGLGSATSGNGITGVAATSGTGIGGVGAGAGNAGLQGQGGTNGPGIAGFGVGSGSGILGAAGATGHGLDVYGGSTSGAGILAHAVGSGNGIQASGASNGSGIYGIGNGVGSGVTAQAGATGNGVHALGGAASGNGIVAAAVGAGTGITAFGVGSVSLLATEGISGPLDASERSAIADALLKRDFVGLTGEAAFSMLNALRVLRNWSISGTTLTAWKEDGVGGTAAWTGTATTDAAAVPVVSFTS